MAGEDIIEFMAGIGRHVPIYKKMKARSICLVDFNKEAMMQAKQKYDDVETIHAELSEHLKNEERKFKVAIGVWTASYMNN